MKTPVEVKVWPLTLLHRMAQVGKLVQAGDSSVQKYVDNNAVRIVDGKPQFHRERFLSLYADELVEKRLVEADRLIAASSEFLDSKGA